MSRVTKAVTGRNKHRKVLRLAKGYYGARSRLFKTAKQSNIKSLQYAFRDRKNRLQELMLLRGKMEYLILILFVYYMRKKLFLTEKFYLK